MPEELKHPRSETRLSFFYQQQLVAVAKKAFQQLAAMLKNATLYPPAHPFLLGSAEQLLLTLEDLFSKRNEAAYYFIGGELFFETYSVPLEESLSLHLEGIAGRDIGGLVFKPGLTRNELVAFAFLMRRDRNSLAAEGGLNALLAREGAAHIAVHKVLPLDVRPTAAREAGGGSATKVFLDAVETVKEIVHAVHIGKTFNIQRLQTVLHTMVDGILDNRDTLLGLTSIKLYDEYTFAHCVNVATLSIALGSFLSFEKQQLAALGLAGMLHDIGKVNVPLEIINKPGALTDEEWEVMKRHPIDGAMILSNMSGISHLAMVSAFEHHQHYGARGYPLTGPSVQLHPFSEIVEIADAYDAITAARVYYGVRTPPHEAVQILIKKRGTSFNPVLVKAFVNMVGIFPIGTLLRLITGETGIVVHQTRDLLRPHVLLLTKFDGTEQEEVSLLEMEGGKYKRSAMSTIYPATMKLDLKLYIK